MRKTLLIAIVAAATACAGPRYLAKVNGAEVTGQDLRREFGKRHRAMEKFLATEPEVRRVLDVVIERRLFVEEARRAGLQDEPLIGAATRSLRERKAVELLVGDEIDAKTRATDQEIKAVYDKAGDMALMREVVLSSRAAAEEVRARALAGEEFETLARERSTAPTRTAGGTFVLRWNTAGDRRREVGLAMHPGDISEVFESDDGWSVLKMDERKTVDLPPLEQVAERIRVVIERRKVQIRDRDFIAEMRAKYAVQPLACDLALPLLEAARAKDDTTPCFTWSGGILTRSRLAWRLPIDELRPLAAKEYGARVKQGADDIVSEQILLAEAQARGLDRRPEVEDAVRAQEESLIVDAYLDRFVSREVSVSDEEVAATYESRKAEFFVPETRLLSQVVVEKPERAATVQKLLAAGEPFDQVATQLTTNEGQRAQGGRIGWVAAKDLPKGFEAVFAARKGDLVEPITFTDGIHLIKVFDIKPRAAIERAEAEKTVREELLEKRRLERFDRFRDQLRAAARIEISSAGIKRYLAENPITEVRPPPASDTTHQPDAPPPPGKAAAGTGHAPGGAPPAMPPPPPPGPGGK